ncbi:MAG: stage II sporulation protein P [Clostridia bacterium]|nr:stage II sporulation protein P [Clostridia bacterium]
MKKKKNFVTFRIVDIRNLVIISTFLIIVTASVSSLGFFIGQNISSQLVKTVVYAGFNQITLPEEINIAQAVLTATSPAITFRTKKPSVQAEILINDEHPTEHPTVPIIPNQAQSITYQSAEEKGYKSIDGIYINNETKKNFDIQALLNKKLDLSISDSPSVLIVHTHTTESYTPSEKYNYIPTETDRTTDLNFNMASVGDVIYQTLTENGINTIHDKAINDHPSYSGSYAKSLKLVKSYMEKYPSIKIVIDVHRDAIVTASGTKMRPLASLDPPCAQVMMVVGTNDSGLEHPHWQDNLSFALKLQHKMNSLYPSLARPVNLRRERFNHHLAPYAFILEVGTNGNTLDEAQEGARLFAESLLSLLKN